MKDAGIATLLIVVLALGVLVSGCVTPPKDNPGGLSQGKGSIDTSTPMETPMHSVIDTQVVTPATPFPTPTTSATFHSYTNLPEPTSEPTAYKVVYRNVMPFANNVTAYSVTVKTPPLFIEMCISPKMVTRNIWYESRYTTREDVYTTQTIISPNAYLEVKVRDRSSGKIIAEDGFAKTYSIDTHRVLTVRTPGDLLVEFSGNDLSVAVQMRVPAEPDETVTPSETLSCPS